MKIFAILLLLVLQACAHKSKTHSEITSEVMEKSFMTTALKSAVEISASCFQPLIALMNKETAAKFQADYQKNFAYGELYNFVKTEWMKQTSETDMSALLSQLESPEWKKFVSGLAAASKKSAAPDLIKIGEQLEAGQIDLKSSRVQNTARVGDQSYTINFQRIANSSVMDTFESPDQKMNSKQKSAFEWQKKELAVMEEASKRGVFVTYYLALSLLSEAELKSVADIRSSNAYVEGKKLLEKEFTVRMSSFFSEISKAFKK